MSRYLLIPVGEGDIKEISIPNGLIVDVCHDLEDRVPDKAALRLLVTNLARHDIIESRDGFVVMKGKELSLKFRDFVVNILNCIFLEEYENFLLDLRKIGITF